jgi:Arc/MetJ-type ribon-helix-helix transcriptional regulator
MWYGHVVHTGDEAGVLPTTVRLDPKTESLLRRPVKKTGRMKSQVVRDAIKRLAMKDGAEFAKSRSYDVFAPFIGIATGEPPDLSERTGEEFTKLLMEEHHRGSD